MKTNAQIGISPETLPHLYTESALLIVTGIKLVHVYYLHEGILKLIESLSQTEESDDRQKGRFDHRTGGAVLGFGEVMNGHIKEEQRRFLAEITTAMMKIHQQYDQVFLFSHMRFSGTVAEALPKEMREKITRKFKGNFTKKHETALLEMIRGNREYTKELHKLAPKRKEVIRLLEMKIMK